MQNRTELPEFLTVEEVAQILRVHPRTIRNRIREGLLPAKQMKGGKSKLVAKADALAQLEDTQSAISGRLQENTIDSSVVSKLDAEPAINRLDTYEGRSQAIEYLRSLREQGDEVDQREAWDILKAGATRTSLRHWMENGIGAEADEVQDENINDRAA